MLTPVPGGVRVRVRVQPRASRSEIVGVAGDALKIRLAAPPVDGAANDALIRFLAGSLHAPRSSLTLVSGRTSRTKVIDIQGISEAAARQALGLG